MSIEKIRDVERGDVIFVDRGYYKHFGVYESPYCIYEYGADTKNSLTAHIRIVNLSEFMKDATKLYSLNFTKTHGVFSTSTVNTPNITSACVENTNSITGILYMLAKRIKLDNYNQLKNYKLYSPDETIERAKSRLGESKYDLAINNCEHFAIWCKTGVSESWQVNSILDIIETNYILEKEIFIN